MALQAMASGPASAVPDTEAAIAAARAETEIARGDLVPTSPGLDKNMDDEDTTSME